MPGILVDAGAPVKTTPRAPPRDYNHPMKTRDLRIERIRPLLPPAILLEEQPLSEKGSLMITRAREEVSDILAGRTTGCSWWSARARSTIRPPPSSTRAASAGWPTSSRRISAS